MFQQSSLLRQHALPGPDLDPLWDPPEIRYRFYPHDLSEFIHAGA